MRVDDLLTRYGLRPIDVRVYGATAIVTIVGTTIVGSMPPSITTGTFADVRSIDAPLIPVMAGVAALSIASLVVGVILAVRLIERRWAWPIGPRIQRPKGIRPYLASGFATLGPAIGVRLIQPVLPDGSVLYHLPGPGDRWLRVVAPADVAAALIAGLVLYVAAFALVLAIEAVVRRPAPGAVSVARDSA